MEDIRFSVITPSYNQEQYIEDTILSVLDQNYNNFEHIIVDGGSTDNTVSILKKYKHLKWISEKDRGQSHALNKGFRIATGDVVSWINSDDYYEKNIFKRVAAYLKENKDCSFLYGDLTYIDKDKNILYKDEGEHLSFNSLVRNPDLVRQPASFWRSNILHEIGFIDENLHYVMDLDYFLRISARYKLYYIPENISFFRQYKENKTLRNKRKQVSEIYYTIKKYSSSIPVETYWMLLKRYFRSYKFTDQLLKLK